MRQAIVVGEGRRGRKKKGEGRREKCGLLHQARE
jgi:hypothetical protein